MPDTAPGSPSRHPLRAHGWLVAAAALALVTAGVLARWDGETAAHLARLSALGSAMILWIGSVGPRGPVALLLLVVVDLLGLAPSGATFAGFAQPSFLFVIAVLAISSTIGTVGTTTRLVQRVLGAARAGPSRGYLWQLPLLMLASAALVSSATARVSLLHPVLSDVADSARAESGMRRYLTLFMANLNPMTSRAFLSGGPGVVVAADLMGRAGLELSWGGWVLWLGVPVALIFALSTIGHLLWLRPEALTRMPSQHDRFTWQDGYVGIVVTVLVVLWIAGPAAGIGAATAALLGMVALTWLPQGREIVRGVDWDLVLFAGATLSFAGILLDTGTAAWMGSLLFEPLRTLDSPYLATVAVFTALVLLRLPLNNGVSYSAMVFPIILSLGDIGGIAAMHIAFMALVASGIVFLPVQSNPTMISFSSGRFGVWDAIRSGLITFVAALVVFQWIAVPYWRFLAGG